MSSSLSLVGGNTLSPLSDVSCVGGAYGLFIIAGAAFAYPRLGAGPTTALMVAAQLTTALVLDHYGLPAGKVEVTPMRLVGAGLLFAGAVLVLWPRLRPEG